MSNEFDASVVPDDEVIDIDLEGVEGKSRSSWEAKEYDAFIDNVEQQTSQAGNPMLVWTLRFPEVNNWTLKHWTVLTGEGKWKVQEILVAAELGEPGSKITFNKRQAIGRRVRVKIKLEEYNGKQQGKVNFVNKHKEGAVVKDSKLPF